MLLSLCRRLWLWLLLWVGSTTFVVLVNSEAMCSNSDGCRYRPFHTCSAWLCPNGGLTFDAWSDIYGTIPPEIASLSYTLNGGWLMPYNKLTGPLPMAIGSLISVTSLEWTFNELTGTLPRSFGSMSNLEVFSMYENEFQGLPISIGSLQNLRQFLLGTNDLSCTLPPALGSLPSITAINFRVCTLLHIHLSINRLSYLRCTVLVFSSIIECGAVYV